MTIRLSPGAASVIPIFGIGLFSGAAGGLLLGATTVVMIQALELLLEDKPLIEPLEKYIVAISKIGGGDIHVSVFAGLFGVFSSTLSLTVGWYLALLTYPLAIRYEGEGAGTKALSDALSVCLTAVTATGLILGFTFRTFLLLTLSTNVVLWSIVGFAGYCMWPLLMYGRYTDLCGLLCGIVFTPAISLLLYFFTFFFTMRSSLAAVWIPVTMGLNRLENARFFKITVVPVPIMLVISDVFNIMGARIVSLQSPISSTLPEAIFIGVFSTLLWAVTAGISFSAFYQTDEADRLFATAAGVGGAVLGVIKLALPVLGPGPTIGALMGVAVAVGVCISAAEARMAKYAPAKSCYGFFGRAGVTMGSAVGAFLSCCAHGGLSKIFVVLCTSMILAALFLKLLILEIPLQRFHLHLLHLFVYFLILLVLMPFTHTTMVTIGIEVILKIVPVGYIICLICVAMTAFLSILMSHSHRVANFFTK